MATFEQFPDDDNYYLVKWIDRVHFPHAVTRSAAIEIFLQKIEIAETSAISRLSISQSKTIFKVHPFKSPESFLKINPRILIGGV